jgi:AraC-like DNA-binding protein
MLRREPGVALRPFVKLLWATDGTAQPVRATREHVLPTGMMHLAFRLSEPLYLYNGPNDSMGRSVGHAIVGGARSTHYLRDISKRTCSVGAQLHPGVAELLFGVPACHLAERHTDLCDLWGQDAHDLLDQLANAPNAAARLDRLEIALTARLPRVRGIHPAVAAALARMTEGPDVAVRTVVEKSGYSHRRFLTLFEQSVGLTPKVYARVLRFQRAVTLLQKDITARTAQIALDAGYSDQPHFTREFRQITGLSPRLYRSATLEFSNHVPVDSNP